MHRILLIDDNRDLLELLASAIEDEGHDVRPANSGLFALQILRGGFKPDLIILDVQMPGMDGPKFLDQLQAEFPKILEHAPVLFSSAGTPPLDSRVKGFIDKMTELGDYLFQLQSHLSESQSARASA